MADPRTELEQLRRLAELEAKAGKASPSTASSFSNVSRPDGSQYDPYNPTVGMSGFDKFAAGMGQGMTNLARGAGQMLGLASQESIDEAKARDKPLNDTFAGTAGNIVGQVAGTLPAMLIPGANTYAGAALTGAAMGALNPTSDGESRAQNTAIGAGFGVAGKGLANALSRVLNPQTSTAAKELIDSGVTPTPGQTLGGFARRSEEAFKSVPFIGQGIRNAEIRANEQFNKAAINKALAPIGKSVASVGNEGLEQARSLVSSSYDDALSTLQRVDLDQSFDDAMKVIKQMALTLPKQQQKQFDAVLKTNLYDRLTPARTVSGETYKTIVSQLNKQAAGYRKTPDFDKQQLGDAIGAAAKELTSLAGRANPVAKEAISKADEAYAMLLRLENAAAKQGAQEGIFSPAQLASAIRSMDGSLRKVNIAQGKGLMQDFAQSGRNVLGETLPNSGTADRLMSAAALGGGFMVDPSVAASLVAGRAAYSKPGQAALVAALAKRPQAVRSAGDMVRRLGPLSAATTAAGANQ